MSQLRFFIPEQLLTLSAGGPLVGATSSICLPLLTVIPGNVAGAYPCHPCQPIGLQNRNPTLKNIVVTAGSIGEFAHGARAVLAELNQQGQGLAPDVGFRFGAPGRNWIVAMNGRRLEQVKVHSCAAFNAEKIPGTVTGCRDWNCPLDCL